MFKRPHLKRTKRQLLSFSTWRLRVVFWSSAIIIGATAAIFALFSAFTDGAFHRLYAYSPLLAYCVTPVGLALIVWLTRQFFVGTEGSGIPQAIAALSMKDRALRASVLSLRIAIGKIILTCAGLLSGASIGREGPTVHVGASLMYSVRHFFPMRSKNMHRSLILAGGAAGISAAFNTPLAGIMFAIEEMNRNFEERTSGVLIISVVLAGVTAIAILGSYTYFGNSSAEMPRSLTAWAAIIFVAIIGGLLGGLFSQILIFSTRRLAPLVQQYPVRVAFVCGLILSLLGFLSGGHTYGTGYEEARGLMSGQTDIGTAYPVYKILATIASYLSGIPGGIFAPSLSVGAGVGAALSSLISSVPFETLVLLGMVSYFTGVVQTPITAFVIVMEMTNGSTMLLPLMTAALIAKGVSHLVCPQPIYQAMAEAYLHKLGQAGKVGH
ncbi:MAG: chloride channel protein [Gammaproteobacteria bacterium]|nr:chloride channel protein [Gammaproteobacteria bacterium]